MKEVMRYLVDDGTVFETIKAAEDHEEKIKIGFELDSKIKELEKVVRAPLLECIAHYEVGSQRAVLANVEFCIQLIAEHICDQ